MARKTVADGYPIKLVRDKIRDLDSVHMGGVQIWAVGSTTRLTMLKKKLLEEAAEYLVDGEVGELADLLEVIECLAKLDHGYDYAALRKLQMDKRRQRGGMLRGHVLYAYPPDSDQSSGSGEGQ
jgi:predicted house-cleaning noncanonical NTP pyrophosphatase (MazG superfamily)